MERLTQNKDTHTHTAYTSAEQAAIDSVTMSMLAGAGDQDVHSGIAQLRVSRCKVPSAVGKLYSVKQLKAFKVILLYKLLPGPDPGSCRRKNFDGHW